MIAQKKKPTDFVEFLLMRETLHGKLICADELEVCGAFLTKKLNQKIIDKNDTIVIVPDLGSIINKHDSKLRYI